MNSDVIYSRREKNGAQIIEKIDTTHIGKLIVTKGVGTDEMVEITEEYKFQEGNLKWGGSIPTEIYLNQILNCKFTDLWY